MSVESVLYTATNTYFYGRNILVLLCNITVLLPKYSGRNSSTITAVCVRLLPSFYGRTSSTSTVGKSMVKVRLFHW
jgi:hypothetical protein